MSRATALKKSTKKLKRAKPLQYTKPLRKAGKVQMDY
jgi:hypothetical protein